MKFIQAKDLYFLAVIALVEVVGWSSSLRLKDYVVRGIAFTAYQLSRNKRRLSQANLSQTLSERLSERQQRDIVKGAFREFWEDVFSLSLSRQEKAALKGVEISGVEHLQNALRERKGAILWESSSFGKRHLAKHILHENGFALFRCMPSAISVDSGPVMAPRPGCDIISLSRFSSGVKSNSLRKSSTCPTRIPWCLPGAC